MDRKQLARAIYSTNYGALRDACAEIAAAASDKEVRPKIETGEEFANLLWDWAEATVDDEPLQSSR